MIPDAVSFTVRNLPKPLHAALTKLASANRRSINAEVVVAIEGYIASAPPSQDVIELMDALRSSLSRRPAKHAKGKR